MKVNEIMENASVGSTSAGGVATLAQPLAGIISRAGQSLINGKYTTESTPNTPNEFKRYKNNAVGRFKNSVGH